MVLNDDALLRTIKLHKRATAKISRIKQEKLGGPIISGSKSDPRESLITVRNMNGKELAEYANKLGAFLDRSNQYVSGYGRRPLSRKGFNDYKKLEGKIREKIKNEYDKIKDLTLPTGQTIEQWETGRIGIRVNYPTYMGPSGTPNLKNEQIYSQSALDKYRDKALRALNDPTYSKELLDRNRDTLAQMVSNASLDNEIASRVKALSENNFRLLWNYTPFVSLLAFVYEMSKAKLRGDKGYVIDDDGMQHLRNRLNDLITWAENLEL